MRLSRKQREIEARKAADPLSQVVGRDDIDYGSDDLPSAPPIILKASAPPDLGPMAQIQHETQKRAESAVPLDETSESFFTRSSYLVLGKQTPLLAVLKKRYPDAKWAEQKGGPLARINVDELVAMEPDPVEKAWLESLG